MIAHVHEGLIRRCYAAFNARDLDAALAGVHPDGDWPMIGRRQLRSNNSWMHNAPRLMKGADRCTALLHPDDASARGLSDGDRARVVSAVGAIELPLEVTDEMRPGVVSVPHGFGHARGGVGWRLAAGKAGASVNDICGPFVCLSCSDVLSVWPSLRLRLQKKEPDWSLGPRRRI